jgi:hypothetical protein
MLTVGPVEVQELCVAAIISLSENIKGPQIAAYYGTVVPILKQLLEYARQSRFLSIYFCMNACISFVCRFKLIHFFLLLRIDVLFTQTIECCAMFGEASGKEIFAADATAMMHSLAEMAPESGSLSCMMKAWVRIARCLEEDFLPFLPFVMSTLLKVLSQDVRVTGEDADGNDLDERSDVDFIDTEEGFVAIRTSAIEEQSSALKVCHKHIFYLYIYYFIFHVNQS